MYSKTSIYKQMKAISHLKELKKRFVISFIFSIISFAILYYFIENIALFISKPLKINQEVVFISTSITETFFSYLSLSAYCAIGVSTPFYLVQVYLFLRPGMYQSERKTVYLAFTGFVVMFVIGAMFMYYLVLPKAVLFLTKYQQSAVINIKMHAKISELVSTILYLVIGFGIAFQLPLVLILLAKYGLITHQTLVSKRRFAILFIFIFAAFATPPDIISQIILATVMMALYEVTVLIIKKLRK